MPLNVRSGCTQPVVCVSTLVMRQEGKLEVRGTVDFFVVVGFVLSEIIIELAFIYCTE